jgi:hypothetical protein
MEMTKKVSWLQRHLTFSNNGLMMKVMNSKLLSAPSTIYTIYFLLAFVITQILWLPFGSVTVLVISFLFMVFSNYVGTDLMSIINLSSITRLVYTLLFAIAMISGQSLIFLFFARRLELLRKEKKQLSSIKLVVITSTSFSYCYFIYSIQNWWFLN